MSKYQRQEAWRKRNPLADWAHYATRSATRRNIIQKQPCEVCGDTASEAHHPDYSQPLLVVWLCRAHHKAHHADLKRAERGGDGEN